MTGTPKTRVRPVKVRLQDRQLVTTRLRGVGWRSECDCGDRSRVRRTRREAIREKDAHTEWHSHVTRASLAGPV